MTPTTTERPEVSTHNEHRQLAATALSQDKRMGLTELAGLAALATVLPGCGGGGDESASGALAAGDGRATRLEAQGSEASTRAPVDAPPRMSAEEASRFLSQAGMGGTAADIDLVRSLGYDAWLTEQFNAPRSSKYVSLIGPRGADRDGNNESSNSGGSNAVERALWRKFITGPDVLRQRVTLALSEIFVVSISGTSVNNRGFAVAAYLDILEGNAFGNCRDLLMQVSTSAAMGAYLSFKNNKKANVITGSQPDENFARELMQLFTIGLVKLNQDGTTVLVNDAAVETYTQADVVGLARVFTGWDLNEDRNPETDRVTKPMQQESKWHELGEKRFLGATIPAGTQGEKSLALAVDVLMAHPNMGPFIGRQLIQRLVKSHPSPAYVERVAAAFNGNTQRKKGDMQATLRAVLLDHEARAGAGLSDPLHGKLREPMLRFLHWARLVKLSQSSKDRYDIGDVSGSSDALGQSPLRSPSVFNFFRPGFVPPSAGFAAQGITAPEFQITNESSVAGYLNFMQKAVADGIKGSKPNYSAWVPLVANSAALLNELNVLLAAGQISAVTLAALATALDSIDIGTDAGKLRRVHAAVLLVMAAPEYLVQK